MQNEIIYLINLQDLNEEAQHYLVRDLSNEEIKIVKEKLEWGLGESLNTIYHSIFSENILKN